MREIYIDFFVGNTSLRIGKQQIVWGQTDGLKVLDVINPQSFQEFILDDFESSRIPLWSLNADISLNDNISLQLLWVPDSTYHEFARPGSTFDFQSPLLKFAGSEKEKISNVFRSKPNRFLYDSDAGIQLAFFYNGWDITFNYFYHYDDSPVTYQIELYEAVGIETRYKRNHLFGGSMTKAFKNLVLRSEYGYNTNKFFRCCSTNSGIDFAETQEKLLAVALDYNVNRDLFISGQLLLSDIVQSNTKFIRDKLETAVTLLIRKSLFNESLTLENFVIHSVNNNDGVIRPKVFYEYKSNVALWAGFDVFYGSSFGYFGQFNELDRLNFGIKVGI